ncbi:MAG: hypothetical protein KAQ92_06695, partial [Candidatus Aenigmarchaeota archaeon]|nr:hypothetical protein [Candidatus Aenigmarchaeota archaeon]
DMDGQACAINYENGIENMILSVNIENPQGQKAVWIFPVPAKPEDTKIDIIKEFPKFHGYDVESRANKELSDAFDLIEISQIFNVNALLFFTSTLTKTMGLRSMGLTDGFNSDVQIHTRIEKNGLTTELLTTKNSDSLYAYLKDKEADMPHEFLSILDEYIGEEYSFVISWISDVDEFKKSQTPIQKKTDIDEKDFRRMVRALNGDDENLTEEEPNLIYTIRTYLSFPTDKIYFPLKTTSIYGDKEIPMLVYVIDYVEPEIYREIKENTNVNYFFQKDHNVPTELTSFFNGKNTIENLRYTRIKINSQSLNLIDNLWIKESVPTKIVLKEYISKYAWLLGIILFIICSCIASMISGMIVFRKSNPSKKKFALFGLFNFLTLSGFAIATYVIKINEKFTELKEENSKPRDLKKPILTTLAIISIPSFIILSMLFSWSDCFWEKIVAIIICFLLIFPFIYGFYNNRKILKFIILFSIIFLILIYILQAGLGFII